MSISAGQVHVDLGARLDRSEFERYERELKKVQARVARREHFKAQLGADFDPRAFNAYERELRKADHANDNMVKSNGRLRTSFGSVWARGGAAFAAAGGAYAVVNAVKGVTKAYADSQVSQTKMRAQLKALGIDYDAHAKQIDAVIQRTSKLAGLDDEDLQDAFTAIVRSTGSVNTGLKEMTLVADLARAKHMDVAAAGQTVARVHAGNVRVLKSLGIEFVTSTKHVDELKKSTKDYTPAQLAAAKAADKHADSTRAIGLLQDKLKGTASAYGRTQAGAMDRARVAIENLQETLGEKLAPTLTRAANGLAKFVNEMDAGTGRGGRFVDFLQAIGRGFTLFARAVRTVAGVVATFFEGMIRGFQLIGEAGSHLPGVGGKFRKLATDADHAADKLRDFKKRMNLSVEAGRVNDDLERMRKKTGSSMTDIRRSVRDGMKIVKDRLGTDTQIGRDALARHFRSMVARIREAMADGKTSTKDGLAQIRLVMLTELKELGIPVAQAKGKPLSSRAPKDGKVPVVKAVGGWIGAPGVVGHDTVPAMLAPGEAVLNRHQQGVIESMLGEGFLDQLFARVQKPHYLARGGRVRFARGGETGGRFLQLPENIQVTHQTGGLAGYPAQDIFASPGTRVGAPVGGVIARLSGQAGGPGGGGPFGYSIYLNGSNDRSYFLTHFGSTTVRAGQHVRRGQIIGTVADYPDRPDHIHEGVHGGLTGVSAGGGPQGAVAAVWKAIKAPQSAMDGMLGAVVQGTLDTATAAANRRGRALAATASGPGTPAAGPGGGSNQANRALGRQMAADRGWTGAQFAALDRLWQGESGWSNTARNASSGAFGIPQALPPGKMGAAAAGGNPRAQIAWGLSYIAQRYGDPVAAYRAWLSRSPHWYAKGGRAGRKAGGAGKERAWLDRSWGQVAPLFGLPADSSLGSLFKHIRLSKGNEFVGVASDPGAKGHETDDLLWPRWLWQSSKGQKALDQRSKLQLFIHEMAHRFQSPDATSTQWESEGGAEAFARIAMDRQFGGRRSNKGDPYNKFVTRVVKRHGMDWIARAQFGLSGGGVIPGYAKGKPGKPSKLVRTVGGHTAGLMRKIRPVQTDRSERFDALMARVETADQNYSRVERRFNISDEELVDADTGQINVGAIKRKAKELGQLILIRVGIERDLEMARDIAKAAVRSYRKIVSALRKSLRHATKKNRKGIRSYINQYEPRIGEWQEKVGEVGGTLFDARTDVLELKGELKDVLGTVPNIPTPDTSDISDVSDFTDTSTADTSSAESAPPTPLQIAEAASAEMRTFLSGRQELLSTFGRNFVPTSQAAGVFRSPDPLTAAAGVRAFGGAGTGGGLGGATIVNNYNQLPDNTQTWAEQMRFVVGG